MLTGRYLNKVKLLSSNRTKLISLITLKAQESNIPEAQRRASALHPTPNGLVYWAC